MINKNCFLPRLKLIHCRPIMLRTLVLSSAVTIVAVLAAVYFSHPVPSGLEFPAEARRSKVIANVVQKFTELTSWLGLGNEVRMNQWFSQTFSKIIRAPDDPLVVTEHSVMDGVPVIIYRYRWPDGPQDKLQPAVVFIHGGGWVVMNTDYYHRVLQNMVQKTKLTFVSIEYKLAPDNLFPGPVHDCAKVVKFFIQNAEEYGADKNRVITLGDSAGGNLVAAVNLLLRDEQFTPQPKLQILVYPYLQMLDLRLPSYQSGYDIVTSLPVCSNYGLWYLLGHNDYKEIVMANRHVSAGTFNAHAHKIAHDLIPNAFKSDNYQTPKKSTAKGISVAFDELVTNPLFSPLMADDLSGLPTSLVQTCQYDVLRDDGILYARRMQASNVKVKYINYESNYHGEFLRNVKFADDIVDFIRENV